MAGVVLDLGTDIQKHNCTGVKICKQLVRPQLFKIPSLRTIRIQCAVHLGDLLLGNHAQLHP